MRKSINLWDLGTGKMIHAIQTGSNLSAARGSFCKDGSADVLALGTEIWECNKASEEFEHVVSIDIQTSDLKNRITLYKDELGHKRILAVRWFTEWHSVTREYYSRSVTLGLYSGESGSLLESVFTADWSDSKHPKDSGRGGYLEEGKQSRSRSESVGSEDAKSGSSASGATAAAAASSSTTAGGSSSTPALTGATANYRYPDFARLECRLSPNLDYLAVHARDRRRGNRMSMIVWRMRTGKVCINLSPKKHEIAWCNLLEWSADSDMLATSYVEHGGARAAAFNRAATNRLTGFIRIWRVSTKDVWRLPSSIFPPDLRAASLAFSRNGLLAIGGFDGCIRLLDVVNERLISKTQAYIGIVHRIRFSPDGASLLATGSCGESRFVPRNRGSELKCFALPYEYSFKYTLDGVSRGVSSYLRHDGLCQIVAEYVW